MSEQFTAMTQVAFLCICILFTAFSSLSYKIKAMLSNKNGTAKWRLPNDCAASAFILVVVLLAVLRVAGAVLRIVLLVVLRILAVAVVSLVLLFFVVL